MSNDIQ